MWKKIKYRLYILKKIRPFTSGIGHFFLFSLILSLISVVLCFISPLFYKMLIEDVILNRQLNKMQIVISGYLIVFLTGVFISYLKNYLKNRMINRVNFKVKLHIWQGFLKRDFTYYETQSVGDMKMRLEDDTARIDTFVESQLINYGISYVTIIVSIILLFKIEWRMAAFSILIIPFTFWLDHITSNGEKGLNELNRENDQQMSSWLHISIHSWREIKGLNIQKHELRQFVKYIHKSALYYSKWINSWVFRVLIIPKIKDDFLMQFSLIFIGGLLILNGELKIGSLLVFIQYYAILSNAVKTVSTADAELQTAMPYIDRMLIELQEADTTKMKLSKLSDNTNAISFENVSFQYPHGDKNVFHNLSFHINKGERVAIIGKSGCGKTTLLKLMAGLLKPADGKVYFCGMDLADADLSQLHKRMGLVMRDSILLKTTIKENLALGRKDCTDNELDEACKKSGIYDFIKSLPEGYSTLIGESGMRLSGGQRQRIALARLFLRDADIFVFDEATNALDQQTENIIHDAIKDVGESKTLITVANRQSTIDLCSRKIEIDIIFQEPY